MSNFVFCCFTVALLGQSPGNQQAKTDAERLQGTWIGISYEEADGKPVTDDDLKMKLEIKGDRFVVKNGDRLEAQGTLKLLPDKTPKQFNMVTKDLTATGIFKLDGNTLTLCYDGTGKERPTKFRVKSGTAQRLLVLKRQKR